MSEICSKCGLPKDLCVCDTIAKEEQKIIISLVKKKFGKIIRLFYGLVCQQLVLKAAKKLLLPKRRKVQQYPKKLRNLLIHKLANLSLPPASVSRFRKKGFQNNKA